VAHGEQKENPGTGKSISQSRRDAKVEKKTKRLFIVNLCASASLREVAYFFAASNSRGMAMRYGFVKLRHA